jgi:hypothetical protein
LSIIQRHFRASAEEGRAVRNRATSKSTVEPPAFDLTFDKARISYPTIATGGSESCWAPMWRWWSLQRDFCLTPIGFVRGPSITANQSRRRTYSPAKMARTPIEITKMTVAQIQSRTTNKTPAAV